MEQLMIYPYHRGCEALVRHQDMLQDWKLAGLASPKGWGLGNDTVVSGTKEYTVETDYETVLKRCDGVWFVEDGSLKLPPALLEKRLQQAIAGGKRIIYTRLADTEAYENAVRMIPETLRILPVDTGISDSFGMSAAYCMDIHTPVVAVMGLEENTEKLEVQLALRKAFQKRGYRVLSVSSGTGTELLGMYSFPDFMLKPGIGEAEKIIRYNHRIAALEKQEEPELIIAGIPGGALPFNRYNHNGYGMLQYEILEALPVDYLVLCLPWQTDLHKRLQEIGMDIKNKYQIAPGAYHLAAITQDTVDLVSEKQREFLTLDRHFIRTKIKEENDPHLLDVTEEKSCDSLTEDIINCLSEQE